MGLQGGEVGLEKHTTPPQKKRNVKQLKFSVLWNLFCYEMDLVMKQRQGE